MDVVTIKNGSTTIATMTADGTKTATCSGKFMTLNLSATINVEPYDGSISTASSNEG